MKGGDMDFRIHFYFKVDVIRKKNYFVLTTIIKKSNSSINTHIAYKNCKIFYFNMIKHCTLPYDYLTNILMKNCQKYRTHKQ